jgi:hypothetical protein
MGRDSLPGEASENGRLQRQADCSVGDSAGVSGSGSTRIVAIV